MACTTACVQPTPAQAHCSACHETFSGVSLFDAHRHGDVDHRGCYPPTHIPANTRTHTPIPVKNIRGVWRYDVPRTNVPTHTEQRDVETPTPHSA